MFWIEYGAMNFRIDYEYIDYFMRNVDEMPYLINKTKVINQNMCINIFPVLFIESVNK